MLSVGNRIWLSGGYEIVPEWLQGGNGYSATVLGFKEFDFGTLAIAKLEQKIISHNLENDIILRQLIHKNAVGEEKQHAHIFCQEMPSNDFVSKQWLSRNNIYVENHTNYRTI